MYLSERLSEFIVETKYESIPDYVILQAKKCLIDSLACSYGATQTATGKIILKTIEHFSGAGKSTVFDKGYKVPAPYAGYVNGKLANILDFDDTYVGIGHPGATIIASSLAVAEDVDASGKEFLRAIVLAYEISCRIGKAVQPTRDQFNLIWGMGSWQVYGAMVASAVLLDLDKEQLINAFGIAGANAPVSSMRKTILTPKGVNMVKNNFDFSSHNGILASYLAREGFSGPEDIFDGDTGFWRMIGSDQQDENSFVNGLGEEFEIMKMDFKPYPMCRWCQPAVEAGLELMKQNNLNPDNIESIKIKVAKSLTIEPYSLKHPKTMEDIQFSFPFPFAVAISGIPIGPGWFKEEIKQDRRIIDLCNKIELVHDPSADDIFPRKCNSTVEIQDNNGNVYTNYCDTAKGSLEKPMSEVEIEDKFLRLVEPVNEKAKSLLQILKNIEDEMSFHHVSNTL